MHNKPIEINHKVFPILQSLMRENGFPPNKYLVKLGMEDGKKTVYPVTIEEIEDTDIIHVDPDTSVRIAINAINLAAYDGTHISENSRFIAVFEQSMAVRRERDNACAEFSANNKLPLTSVEFCAVHSLAHSKTIGCPKCNQEAFEKAQQIQQK